MDMSKLSSADLAALAANNMSKVSEAGLRILSGAPPQESKAADLGYSALSGLGSLVQFPGQVYGLATGNMDNGLNSVGQSIRDYATGKQSEGLKARQQAQTETINKAEGFFPQAGAAISTTLKDPVLLGNMLAENIVNLIPGFGAARGTMALGMRKVAQEVTAQGLEGEARAVAIRTAQEALQKKATGAAVGVGAAQQGAQVGGDSYEGVYKRLVADGTDPTEAAAKAISLARAAGVSGAAISLLAQALPGARALEKSFAGAPGKGGMLAGIGKGIAGEGVSEALEEGGGQVVQNAAMRAVDPTQDIMQNVGRSAGQAAVLGGVFGGAAGMRNSSVGAEAIEQQQIQERALRAQQVAQQEQQAQQKYQDPAYAQQVAAEYQAAEVEMARLRAAAKVGKDAPMADQIAAEQARKALKEFEEQTLRPKAEEYLKVKPLLDAQQPPAPQAAAPTPDGSLFPDAPTPAAPQTDLFGKPVAPQPGTIPSVEDVVAQQAEAQRQITGLEDALEQQRSVVASVAPQQDAAATQAEIQKFRQIEDALKQAQAQQKMLPPAPKPGPTDDALNKQFAATQKAIQRAAEEGDVDAIERGTKKLAELKTKNPGLFTKDHNAAISADADLLGQEMGIGRDAQARMTAGKDEEIARLREMAARARDPEYANEARVERQNELENIAGEAKNMNTGATEQRTLFPQEGGPVISEMSQTKQAQLQALALELQAARRAYKADPNNTDARKQVDALIEQMRAVKDRVRKGFVGGSIGVEDDVFMLAGTRMPPALPESSGDPTVERSVTPAGASPQSIKAQLARVKTMGRETPLTEQIAASLPALENAKSLDTAADYLYRLRTGQNPEESAAKLQEKLSALEQGKRSDEVPQGDMFPNSELQGTLFNTPEEFQTFLAGDALNESRKAVGLALQTMARAQRTVAPLQAQAAELRQSVETLRTMLAATKRTGDTSIARAQENHAKALARIEAQEKALQDKLAPAQIELISAQLALSKAQDQRAKILDTIAANMLKFNGDIDMQKYAQATASAQSAHAAMLRRIGNGEVVSFEEGRKLYDASVAAINAQRAALEQYLKSGNKLQERSILAFLNRDMEMALRLQVAEQTRAQAQERATAAKQALDAYAKDIKESIDYQAETKVNKRNEAGARGALTRVRKTADTKADVKTKELQARDDERQALEKEIADITRPQQKAQAERAQAPVEAKEVREARDNAQRADEQAQRERLADIPGTKVDFKDARAAVDAAEKFPPRIKELDEKAKDETLPITTRNKAKADAKKLREQAKIAYGILRNDGELNAAAKQEIVNRLAAVDTKISEKQLAINEPGISKATETSRRKTLTDLRSERRQLLALQRMADNRATQTPIETSDARALRKEDEDARQSIESALNVETLGTSGKLPLRKKGPVVRKVGPGQGKVLQGGAVQGITGKQAQKQSKADVAEEQAMMEVTRIEGFQEKNEAALAFATDAGYKDQIDKYTAFKGKIERALAAANAKLEKIQEKAAVRDEKSRLVSAIEDTDIAPSVTRGEASTAPRSSTELDNATKRAIEKGDVRTTLQNIAQNGSTPVVREVASKLLALNTDTRLTTDENVQYDGENVEGTYGPEQNLVTMHPNALTEEAVLHEFTHAATDAVLLKPESQLSPDQRAAKKELESLRQALVNRPEFKGEAIGNVREFAAEAMSNPTLQSKLDALGKPLTLLQRFKNMVARLIGYFGGPAPIKDSAQTRALVERLMSPSSKYKGGESAPSVMRSADDVLDRIVAKDKKLWARIRDNISGLSFETQFVDRFAPLEKVAKIMEPLKGSQMMHYLRSYDYRTQYVAQAASVGVPQRVAKKRADGRTEYIFEAIEGANLSSIAGKIAAAPIANKDRASRLFTGYMSAIRAKNKGLYTLNFSDDITQADLDLIAAEVNANPATKAAFEDARKEYNDYNRNLIKLLVDSGSISDALGKKLVAEDDYIPYYRDKGGVAELLIGSESPIRIGSIADMPYLQELVGGDRAILDFTTSAVQNTGLIIDMALQNTATKNVAYELKELGMATIGKSSGAKGARIIRFMDKGEPRQAVVDTPDSIPAELLVKGMEGIPTQLTGIVRMLAGPAQLLRRAVVLNPLYPVRQVVRDSFSAAMGSGANLIPVYSALKEVNGASKQTLERRGITGGQVFTGSSEDMSKIMRDITAGKPGWMTALGKLESMSMAADALTRRAQYDNFRKQGLSEMEATMQTMESMNFTKRGASPSIHMANAMIPFLNAQIQSLNVLYKAFTGQMPNNERLKIQQKMITRGLMLAATSMAYAASMQDDEAYKNAAPDQKYNNWFVRVPGLDEPVKVPIPFEIGYIFKAIPEALYNSMQSEKGAEEAAKAMKSILINTIPGGSSLGMPQAVKPLIEAATNYSFYRGREIVSPAEQELEKPYQYRDRTTETAKAIGMATGQSPIIIEQLVSGYLGSIGLFAMAAVGSLIPTEDTPEKATRRLSATPILSGLFQTNDAGAIVNSTYEKMNELVAFKKTIDALQQRGENAEAMRLLQENGAKYNAAENLAGAYRQRMGELTKNEKAVRASAMSPDEKQQVLDQLKAAKNQVATQFRAAYDSFNGR